MWHTCLPNASRSHVNRQIGWFNLVSLCVITCHSNAFVTCSCAKPFQKCFNVETFFIISLNTVKPFIVMVCLQSWLDVSTNWLFKLQISYQILSPCRELDTIRPIVYMYIYLTAMRPNLISWTTIFATLLPGLKWPPFFFYLTTLILTYMIDV